MERSNIPEIKHINELGYGTEPPPTKETWAEFQENNAGIGVANMYVSGTYDMLDKLEKIVVLQDFDQMRNELAKLYNERYTFVEHAINNTI